jgi:hypothetical protein
MEGFLSSILILNILKMILKFNNNLTTFLVYGFPDSIVSWKEKVHYNIISGENDYLFIHFDNFDYILYQFFGENDLN